MTTAPPPTAGAVMAFYRLVLRTQLTVPRVLGISGLGALALLLGVFARLADDPDQAAADHVAAFGLGLLVPLAALWLGSSALGDLVDDRLLVYLWLKPVARWQLPAAAVLATASVVIVLAVLPLAAGALIAGAGDVAAVTLVAATLAALAYAGLFVAAGIWFRRAVWWGLAFVLIWENALAYATRGSSSFTVVGWASAILSSAEGITVELDAGSPVLALVILPAIAITGWLAATWRYRRADVD